MMHVYSLHTMSIGLGIDVRLNGVSVATAEGWKGAVSAVDVGSLLAVGSNVLEVFLMDSGPNPDPTSTEERAAEVTLYRYANDTAPAETDVRVQTSFSENETSVGKNELVRVLSHAFLVHDVSGPWLWESGRPAEDVARYGDLLATARSVLERRDMEHLLRLLQGRHMETADANDRLDAAGLAVEARDLWAGRFAAPDYAVAPLDLRTLVFAPAFGGRAVAPRDGRGWPALSGTANGRRWFMPVALAVVDGAMRIVR